MNPIQDCKLIYCHYQKIGEKFLFGYEVADLLTRNPNFPISPGIGNSLKRFHELCQILTKFLFVIATIRIMYHRHHHLKWLQAQRKLFARVRCDSTLKLLDKTQHRESEFGAAIRKRDFINGTHYSQLILNSFIYGLLISSRWLCLVGDDDEYDNAKLKSCDLSKKKERISKEQLNLNSHCTEGKKSTRKKCW